MLTHAFVYVLFDLVVAAMAARVDMRAAAGAIGIVLAAYEPMTVVEYPGYGAEVPAGAAAEAAWWRALCEERLALAAVGQEPAAPPPVLWPDSDCYAWSCAVAVPSPSCSRLARSTSGL